MSARANDRLEGGGETCPVAAAEGKEKQAVAEIAGRKAFCLTD